MQDEVAIHVDSVHKTFHLPHERQTSLKGALLALARGKRGYEVQHVLRGVSFDVKKGEFFGIVGRNGSGKSTLLKVLAGIYTPDRGGVHLSGRLTPFIELGVGFNPELSGRDNIFLNGALLGYSRKEMAAKYDDIVRFAELERFMDQKLKNYSSGMQVRLAFSIAIQSDSEILLFDEVLAVGDERFQKKCVEAFHRLKSEGRTIVLVTHDMANVERFCDRALVLDKSKVIAVTKPAEAATIYARLNVDEQQLQSKDEHGPLRSGSGEVKVKKATLLQNGKQTRVFTTGQPLALRLDLQRQKGYERKPLLCGLAFFNSDGTTIAGPNTLQSNIKDDAASLTYTMPAVPFAPGDYSVTIAVYQPNEHMLDFLDKWVHFSVISDHRVAGVVEVTGEWSDA